MDSREIPEQEWQITQAALIQRSQLLKIYLERDAADLAPRGVTPGVIAALAAQSALFDALKTDSWWVDEITAAVAARDAKRHAVMLMIEELRDICEQTLEPIAYNSFGFEYLALTENDEFIKRVQRILARAADNQAALTPEGATPAMIAALTTALEELDDLYDAALVAETVRDKKLQERRIEGNSLWQMMKKLCNKAITYYRRRDPATTNDYKDLLKRDANVQPPPAPANVIVNPQTLLVMWNVALNATSYIVQTQESGANTWTIDAQGITTTQFQLAARVGTFKVRVIAHNAGGNSVPSAEITVEPILTSPGGFAYSAGVFTWVMVAGITQYEMEASYDNGATWNQVFDTDFTEGSYTWTPPAGMFRIRSKNGSLVSDWVIITVA